MHCRRGVAPYDPNSRALSRQALRLFQRPPRRSGDEQAAPGQATDAVGHRANAGLSAFVVDAHLTASQIAFVDLVVDHLTAKGSVPLGILYESPFTEVAPLGPDGLFSGDQVVALFGALKQLDQSAMPSEAV